MNAETSIQRDRFDMALDVHVGRIERPEMRSNRRRLLAARDWATQNLSNPRYVDPEALDLYRSIRDHASRWCFALPGCEKDAQCIADAAENCRALALVAQRMRAMEPVMEIIPDE